MERSLQYESLIGAVCEFFDEFSSELKFTYSRYSDTHYTWTAKSTKLMCTFNTDGLFLYMVINSSGVLEFELADPLMFEKLKVALDERNT